MQGMKRIRAIGVLIAAPLAALLGGCNNDQASGVVTADSAQSFDGISATETLRFIGNEPFWGGEAAGGTLIYSTPENPDGSEITVKRFSGLGGLGLSGTLDGASFDMAVTPGECSDTMSDRTYPFTVTLVIGEDTRTGCGWTDAQPFSGPESP